MLSRNARDLDARLMFGNKRCRRLSQNPEECKPILKQLMQCIEKEKKILISKFNK